MNRLLWVVLALLGGGLILLVLNHESGSTLGLGNDAFAHTIYLGVWALVIGAAIAGSRIPLGEIARNAALWLLAILALVSIYQYRYELQDVANRISAGFIPGSPVNVSNNDGVAVMLEKGRSGHFEVRGVVNGERITFVIDTGATSTVLTHADAMRIGIDPSALHFSVPVMTANGQARAARAVTEEIRIGEIARRRVPVLVAAHGQLGQSLLGMNFLGTLSGFDARGDRLVLRD
jgi:aspartyl protease family protein